MWAALLAIALLAGETHFAFALTGTSNEITAADGAMGLVDPLIVGKGGTGVASLTDRAVIIGRGTAAVEFASPGAAGGVLQSAGASSNPAFGALDLTDTDTVGSSVLGVANGGTNLSAALDDNVMVGNGTTWQSKALTDCTGTGKAVTYSTSSNAWGCNTITSGTTAVIGMSTLMDLTGGNTVYIAPGTVDATQGRAQQIATVGMTFDNLRCVSSAAPGTSNTFVVTMGDGACTSALADSAQQVCTISGTNRTCAEVGTGEAVTQGECYAWKVVSLDGDTATAVVSCSAERTS
jgi:hypothetical protein